MLLTGKSTISMGHGFYSVLYLYDEGISKIIAKRKIELIASMAWIIVPPP